MIGHKFNIDEIFEIAVKIEQNGAKFYRLAAESVTDRNQKDFLNEMAAMEETHGDYFGWLRNKFKEYDDSGIVDPEGESSLYLRAIADGQIFNVMEDPAEKIKGKSFEDIVRQAIQVEKDTILLYLGLKNVMLDEEEKKENRYRNR